VPEKNLKMTPINNVYWSYFRINHFKRLIVDLKSLEPPKFFLTISDFSLGLDLSSHNLKLPQTSRETVPLTDRKMAARLGNYCSMYTR
jgi:hypothetical protein